jgi:hypothetical protein
MRIVVFTDFYSHKSDIAVLQRGFESLSTLTSKDLNLISQTTGNLEL